MDHNAETEAEPSRALPNIDGRYSDISPIAERGLACAFAATDTRTNERVFLKILRESKLQDAQAFRLFCQEPALLQMIEREAPHIPVPPVLETGYWHERPYFTQPFLTGWSLDKAMRNRVAFSGPSVLRIIEGCLEFLTLLHDTGLIHGDLSPDNIFIETDEPVAEQGTMPDRFSIKLLDYNSSRRLSEHKGSLDGRNVVFLKLPYAAPEIAHGQPLSVQTDLYALGVVVFELLVGARPRHEPKSMEDVRKLRDEIVPAIPSELGVPRPIEGFARSLLAADPASRFKSAAECLRELQGFRNVQTWLAQEDPVPILTRYYLPESRDYFVEGSLARPVPEPLPSVVSANVLAADESPSPITTTKFVVEAQYDGYFVIEELTGTKRHWDLLPGASLTAGRSGLGDIHIDDPRVSRKAAVIARDSTSAPAIENFNHARVPLTINGTAIETGTSCGLHENDLIEILDHQFRVFFVDQSATANPTTRRGKSHRPQDISVEVSLAYDVPIPVHRKAEDDSLKRLSEALTSLYEMTKTLGSGFDIDRILESATEIIFRNVPADRVLVLLIAEGTSAIDEEPELTPVAVRSRDEGFRDTTRAIFGREVARRVMKDRVALLSQDAAADEQLAAIDSIVSEGVRSIICAPMISDASVYGAIYADRLDAFVSFKPSDLELINAVASLTALGIENVRTHERLVSDEVARANYSRFMPNYIVEEMLEQTVHTGSYHVDPAPDREQETQLVDFSVFAPCTVTPDASFILEIWAYLRDQRDEVLERAGRHGRLIERGSRGPVYVPGRTELTLVLRLDRFELQETQDTVLWCGDITNVAFIIRAPKHLPAGIYPGQISILNGGMLLTRLIFELTVGETMDEQASLNLHRQEFKTAFASYASSDRDEVLRRVQGIQATGMDVFLDVLSLRAGEHWQEELFKHIRSRDIFYLFWSVAASQSEWVNREWRYALNEKGLDFIHPIPLAAPSEAPPPEELRNKHFNDMILACLKSQTLAAMIE